MSRAGIAFLPLKFQHSVIEDCVGKMFKPFDRIFHTLITGISQLLNSEMLKTFLVSALDLAHKPLDLALIIVDCLDVLLSLLY